MKNRREQGITLIALVITMIIIFILAGVSLLVFGKNGLVETAKEAALAQKIAEYKTLIDSVKARVAIKNEGNVPIDKFLDELKKQEVVNDSQIKDNGDGSYTITPEPGIDIIVRPTEDGNNVKIEYPIPDGVDIGGNTGGNSNETGGNTQGGSGTGTNIKAQQIAFSINSPKVEVGKTLTLTVTFTPSNTSNKVLAWTSSDETVATINNGAVTGIKEGTTVITATTTDGSNLTATCTVTVIKSATELLKAGNTYVNYIDKNGNTIKCVVLYEASSQYGLQIISADSVADVPIGYNEGGWNQSISNGIEQYNNAIKILNEKATEYLNETYATSARCVGSVPNNPSSEPSGYFYCNSNQSSWVKESTNGKLKKTDTNYVTDYNQMEKLNILDINKEYWLASRFVYDLSSYLFIHIRAFPTRNESHGEVSGVTMCSWNPTEASTNANRETLGFRPVFTLKSGISITSGTGSVNDPYNIDV